MGSVFYCRAFYHEMAVLLNTSHFSAYDGHGGGQIYSVAEFKHLKIQTLSLASEYLEHFLTMTAGPDFFEDLDYFACLVNKKRGPVDAHVFSSHEFLKSINAILF